jgi:outer membrane protein assembly factor BamB
MTLHNPFWTARIPQRSLFLLALLAALSGLAGCGGNGGHGDPAASPASGSPLAQLTIYTTATTPPNDFSGAIVAFNAANGAKRFSYGGGETGEIGFEVSPAVVNGVAYAGAHRVPPPCSVPSACPRLQYGVYALDLATGAVRWQAPVDGWVYSPTEVVNGVVYVTTSPYGDPGAHSVYALRASDGTPLWHFAANARMEGAPVVVDGVVYVSSGYVYAWRADTGALLWRSAALVGAVPPR